jgi:hypothetical protein
MLGVTTTTGAFVAEGLIGENNRKYVERQIASNAKFTWFSRPVHRTK